MIFEISRVCAVSALTTTIVCLTCSLLSIINNLKIKVNISFAILSRRVVFFKFSYVYS